MSHDLDALIVSELEQLDLLISTRRSLLTRRIAGPVTVEELDALSALLHSAYTAMERIMFHAAKKAGLHDVASRTSSMRHTILLNPLADAHPPVLSAELHGRLRDYLGFRHVFRHAYLHELKWGKMRPLVENLEAVVSCFRSEIMEWMQKKA